MSAMDLSLSSRSSVMSPTGGNNAQPPAPPCSMSSNATADDECAADDNLCRTRTHQLEVIIVPTLLLLASLVTLLALCLSRSCPERRRMRTTAPQRYGSSSHTRTHRHTHRQHLQGIDAPVGINPLEHEEMPMSARPAVPQITTGRPGGTFTHVTALPLTFCVKPDAAVSLYRARLDNRDVVLRVLREAASDRERQHFLGFASFMSGLGPHPFIPALVGVVSRQSPLTMVVEELQHRDLLGFLWRCRQDNPGLDVSCDMTEKRIFTMAGQVASALEYLHGHSCIHGNLGARSVLVAGDLTAKLWGLGSAYRRGAQAAAPGEVEAMEMRKWQAPEVLARRGVSHSSDVWSFGILLYEMVTLGDPPFAQLMATEVLQFLQRGNHLRRPANCSSSLFSIIRSCCQWSPQQRISTSGLLRKLQAGEKSANGRTVLRVPEPLDIEKYLREAGYGESYNYAVL